MLTNIFTNRFFIVALGFFVLCVGGSLLYRQHVDRQGAEDAAETEARVEQWNERQKQQSPAETPVSDTSQGGDSHADGTLHGEPHEILPTESEAEIEHSVPRRQRYRKKNQTKQPTIRTMSSAQRNISGYMSGYVPN